MKNSELVQVRGPWLASGNEALELAPPPAHANTSFLLGFWIYVGLGLVLPGIMANFAGGALRLAYPVYVLAIGLVLIQKKRSLYPGFCVTVFAFGPFLRRLADFHAGFVAFNPIHLAPYFALLPCYFYLLRVLFEARARSFKTAFTIILICILYALVIALFDDKLVTGTFDALRWSGPLALASFILAEPAEASLVQRDFVRALVCLVPILSVYGIFQYFSPPAWDVYWMDNVDNPTFGQPVPYEIRIFSMMNSPGTFGMFLGFAIPILVGEGGFALTIAMAGLPALALTLIRVGWIAGAVGTLVAIAHAPLSRKLTFGAAALLIAMVPLVSDYLPLPPETLQAVQQRVASFADLGTDTSANERLDTYGLFFDRLNQSPFGEGFGANASATAASERRTAIYLDSGILETFLTFGVIGGIAYLFALGWLLWLGFKAMQHSGGLLSGYFGAICGAIAAFPGGTVHIGESGIVIWTGLAILLTSAEMTERDVHGTLISVPDFSPRAKSTRRR